MVAESELVVAEPPLRPGGEGQVEQRHKEEGEGFVGGGVVEEPGVCEMSVQGKS